MRLCRLCESKTSVVFKNTRHFFACTNCGLIFSDCPLPEQEKQAHYTGQYDNGFNWENEARYFTKFLPAEKISYKILDYGSGGGHLANELRKTGYDIDCYEPMFHGEFDMLQHYGAYDFIILNEVIEHVEHLKNILENINYSLKPGGQVLIKTMVTDGLISDPYNFEYNFKEWWYKDDLTHISFFSSITFEYICANMFSAFKIIRQDVLSILLQKRIIKDVSAKPPFAQET